MVLTLRILVLTCRTKTEPRFIISPSAIKIHVWDTYWRDFPRQRYGCIHCNGWRKLQVFSSGVWTELPLLVGWMTFSCCYPRCQSPWSSRDGTGFIARYQFGWEVSEERLRWELRWVRLLGQLDSLKGFNGALGKFGGGINEWRGLLVGQGWGRSVGGISVHGGQGSAVNLPQSHWEKREIIVREGWNT